MAVQLSAQALQRKAVQHAANRACGCGMQHCAMCGMERRPNEAAYGESNAEPFHEEDGDLYCRFCHPLYWDNPEEAY